MCCQHEQMRNEWPRSAEGYGTLSHRCFVLRSRSVRAPCPISESALSACSSRVPCRCLLVGICLWHFRFCSVSRLLPLYFLCASSCCGYSVAGGVLLGPVPRFHPPPIPRVAAEPASASSRGLLLTYRVRFAHRFDIRRSFARTMLWLVPPHCCSDSWIRDCAAIC